MKTPTSMPWASSTAGLPAFLEDRSRWTLREIALTRLAESANRPFLNVVGGPTETYGEFIGRASSLARFLKQRGVEKGDTVGVFCQPGAPALHGWLATAFIGAIDVTINPAYRGEVLRHALVTTKPKVILVDADLCSVLAEITESIPFLRDMVVVGEYDMTKVVSSIEKSSYTAIVDTAEGGPPLERIAPADASTTMFTSGTTGPSKAALLPNGQACLMALQVIGATGLCEDDVYYCVHPLNHIAGKFMGILATFVVGGRLILDRRFDAGKWLSRIREYDVTMSIVHGPMIEMICATPATNHDRDHAMRRIMCCPMPKAIGSDFEERFALRGVEMWGMTEIGCPLWTPLSEPRAPGSCGRLLDSWYEMKVADPETDEEVEPGIVGEFMVRPRYPSMTMKRYFGNNAATVDAWRNLWFHTGDVGYSDSSDNFYFVDRLRERIRRRAENISSFDIEEAACRFPGIAEAAAIGVPSGMEGDDDIKLCIVASPNFEPDPAEIIRFLFNELPHFMVPRYVEVLDALPRTPTNKVRKRQLMEAGMTLGTWDRIAAGFRLKELRVGPKSSD